jgi:hypothetical protein
MIPALIAGGLGLAGSLIGGNKAAKAQEKAQTQALQAQAIQAQQEQAWARENAQWALDQNKAIADTEFNKNWDASLKALDINRPNQTSAFGSSTWTTDPATGKQTQTIGINSADQATLDALRGKREGLVGGLGGGFDVQGDVMNAYRALQQPLLDESRERENARLAAMGLSTGSGSAWQTAQRSLNDAQSRADQEAILQGFKADLDLRQSNRADLGLTEQMMNGFQNRTQMPTFAQFGKPNYDVPSVGAPGSPSFDAMGALKYGQEAGANTQQNWNELGTGLGQLGAEAWKNWAVPGSKTPSTGNSWGIGGTADKSGGGSWFGLGGG